MNRFFPNHDTYKITSPFGMRTLRGVTKMHNGIDLVARTSAGGSALDAITAHTGGTVAAVGYDASAGNFVKLQTDAQTQMVYYHLRDKPALMKGAKVRTGDIIGYMGATGNVTGAHLHFGIKRNGKWIDPEPWLDTDLPKPEEGNHLQAGRSHPVQMPVVKRGDRGPIVENIQRMLLGHDQDITVDSKYGPATEAAVKEVQKKNGLVNDGVVGKKTWPVLLKI